MVFANIGDVCNRYSDLSRAQADRHAMRNSSDEQCDDAYDQKDSC
jgi:hypothetical protein